MSVKVQKQGKALVVSLPTELNVQAGAEFDVVQEKNGVISLVPVHENIFAKHPSYDLQSGIAALGLGDQGRPVGKENVW